MTGHRSHGDGDLIIDQYLYSLKYWREIVAIENFPRREIYASVAGRLKQIEESPASSSRLPEYQKVIYLANIMQTSLHPYHISQSVLLQWNRRFCEVVINPRVCPETQ